MSRWRFVFSLFIALVVVSACSSGNSNSLPTSTSVPPPTLLTKDAARAVCFAPNDAIAWSDSDISDFISIALPYMDASNFNKLALATHENMHCAAVQAFSFWWPTYTGISAARNRPTVNESTAWNDFNAGWQQLGG